MVTLTRAIAAVCLLLPAVCSVSAAELGTYRDFRLGSTAAAVMAITESRTTELKTDHERPALLQQLAWRPYRTDAKSGLQSVRTIDFRFIGDQLYRMTIDYEGTRTAGLTVADMIMSLEAVYGPRSPLRAQATPTTRYDSLDTPAVIAVWRGGDVMLALQHVEYSNRYSLVISEIALDRIARKAQADAVVMDAREAPAREAALARKQADDARATQEKTRSTNKDAFTP